MIIESNVQCRRAEVIQLISMTTEEIEFWIIFFTKLVLIPLNIHKRGSTYVDLCIDLLGRKYHSIYFQLLKLSAKFYNGKLTGAAQNKE